MKGYPELWCLVRVLRGTSHVGYLRELLERVRVECCEVEAPSLFAAPADEAVVEIIFRFRKGPFLMKGFKLEWGGIVVWGMDPSAAIVVGSGFCFCKWLGGCRDGTRRTDLVVCCTEWLASGTVETHGISRARGLFHWVSVAVIRGEISLCGRMIRDGRAYDRGL